MRGSSALPGQATGPGIGSPASVGRVDLKPSTSVSVLQPGSVRTFLGRRPPGLDDAGRAPAPPAGATGPAARSTPAESSTSAGGRPSAGKPTGSPPEGDTGRTTQEPSTSLGAGPGSSHAPRTRLAPGAARNPIALEATQGGWIDAKNTYALEGDRKFHTFEGGHLVYDAGDGRIPGALSPLDRFPTASHAAKIYPDPRPAGAARQDLLAVQDDGSLRTYDRTRQQWSDIAPSVRHQDAAATTSGQERSPATRPLGGLKGGAPPPGRFAGGRPPLHTRHEPIGENDPRVQEARDKYLRGDDHSLLKIFNDPDEIAQEYNSKKIYETLPFDAYYALRRYQNGSTQLNANLGAGNLSSDETYHTRDLEQAIKTGLDLGYGHGSSTVYRGAQLPPDFHGKLSTPDGAVAPLPAPEVTYRPDHFVSTSTDRRIAEGFTQSIFEAPGTKPYMFEIRPRAQTGVNITDMLGDTLFNQDEVLFPRDTRFIIDEVGTDSLGASGQDVSLLKMHMAAPKRTAAGIDVDQDAEGDVDVDVASQAKRTLAPESAGLLPSPLPSSPTGYSPLAPDDFWTWSSGGEASSLEVPGGPADTPKSPIPVAASEHASEAGKSPARSERRDSDSVPFDLDEFLEFARRTPDLPSFSPTSSDAVLSSDQPHQG